MVNFGKILLDGGIYSILGGIYLLTLFRLNPRIFLNKGDLPRDILDAVPPKTDSEKRLAAIFGIPFMILVFAVPLVSTWQVEQQAGEGVSFLTLFLHAFGVLMVFNLFDLIVLDWLVFCTITPAFMVVPGTAGLAGYKDYGFHLRQHSRAFIGLVIVALVVAGIVALL